MSLVQTYQIEDSANVLLSTSLPAAYAAANNFSTAGYISNSGITTSNATVARTAVLRGGDVFNVKDFGAMGDCSYLTNIIMSIASGSSYLTTSAGTVFQPNCVGKTIVVGGAGPSGNSIVTTITSYNTNRNVTINAVATTTVTSNTSYIVIGTDDSTAINQAIQAAVTFSSSNQNSKSFRSQVYFPQGRYLANAGINVTGIRASPGGFHLQGDGAIIHSTNANWNSGTGVAVDACGSLNICWDGINIHGDYLAPPAVGLQVGRNVSVTSSDRHCFSNMDIYGAFSRSCLYNSSAETTKWDRVHFYNYYQIPAGGPTPNTYCIIMDGVNYWNIASDFASVTPYANVGQSFNENTFLQPVFHQDGNGSIGWISSTKRMKIINGYGAGTPNQPAFILYTYLGTTGDIPFLEIDCHIETLFSDWFLVTGNTGTAQIRGLKLKDHNSDVNTSIFRVDLSSPITNIYLYDAEVKILQLQQNASVVLFNEPAYWTVSGNFTLPAESNFNAINYNGTVSDYGTNNLNVTFTTTNTSTLNFTVPTPGLTPVATTANIGTIYMKNVANTILEYTTFPMANNTNYNTDVPRQSHMGYRNIYRVMPSANGTSTGVGANTTLFFSDGMSMNVTCNAQTSIFPSNTSPILKNSMRRIVLNANSTLLANANAWLIANQNVVWTGNGSGAGNGGGFFFTETFSVDTMSTNTNFFAGMSNLTAPATAYVDVQSNTKYNMFGFGGNPTAGHLKCICGPAGVARNVTDLGVKFSLPAPSDVYEVTIASPPGGATLGMRVRNLANGAEFSFITSSNTPTANSFLQPVSFIQGNVLLGTDTPDVQIGIMRMYLETLY